MATPSPSSTSCFSFNLSLSLTNLTTSKVGPRLGTISLRRTGTGIETPSASNETQLTLRTPTFITTTSRGIVPHLSRDNLRRTPAVRWVNAPFETFMEHSPPVPIVFPSKDPLHTFLGFERGKQIVSLSARDPNDVREMPPNGNAAVSVWTLRGVRKLSPSDWRAYTLKCQPDVVFALSDSPFTDPINHAYSQKRLTKSIERTAAWLSEMLRPWSSAPENGNERGKKTEKKETNANADPSASSNSQPPYNTFPPPNPKPNPRLSLPIDPLPPIFLPMAGGSSLGARRAFASSLLEPFYGPDAEAMKGRGIKTLDEGVVGYSFDLASLRGETEVPEGLNGSTPKVAATVVEGGEVEAEPSLPTPADIISLIQTSLTPLTPSKPRLVNSTNGPHEILRFITQVGVDVFDAAWAQHLAGWGVGLDFEFPVRASQKEGRRSIGHNLYDQTYAFDFGTIADTFRGASEDDHRPICACAACSPLSPLDQDQIRHGVDSPEHTLVPGQSAPTLQKHHTRAYIHHLLHTHEMSAHTLLAMHNLTVLDRFFEGVREVLGALGSLSAPSSSGDEEGGMRKWTDEVDLFCQTYDEVKSREVFERARGGWRDVDRARGKGRLAREREKDKEGEIPN